MGRSKGNISESLEFLRELERRYHGKPQEMRVKALRLLREQAGLTMREISGVLGISERQIRRWWQTYRTGGLDSLLEIRSAGGQRPTRVSRQTLDTLRAKADQMELTSLREIQRWLREECAVEYSISGIGHLVRRELRSTRLEKVLARAGAGAAYNSISKAIPLIPEDILRFMNAIPITGHSLDWINAFRSALLRLLKDVDRISVNVNLNCNLHDPLGSTRIQHVTQHITPEGNRRQVAVGSYEKDSLPSDELLEGFRRQGLPLHIYHPPSIFNYYHAGVEYAGTIFLWREREKPAISEQTLTMIGTMEPFMVYAITSHVAWYQNHKPTERQFHEYLQNLIGEANLTQSEQRVAMLQILGHPIKEIAEILSVSLVTVKKHIGAVHRKTATRSINELMAKYFTPRLSESDPNADPTT
jgi:transposase